MCGRYASAKHDIDLIGDLDLDEVDGEQPPLSWNIAPTQDARVVVQSAGRGQSRQLRKLRTLRWGLVPSWAEHPKVGSSMINARVETVFDKPAFRSAVMRRRCLVPADGYYEWRRQPDGPSVPHYLCQPESVTFAGLYEFWRDPQRADGDPDRWLATFAILTSAAPAELAHIHDRAPIVVPPERRHDWLDRDFVDPPGVRALLDEIPAPMFIAIEVSRDVNNHRNNGPHLISPATT